MLDLVADKYTLVATSEILGKYGLMTCKMGQLLEDTVAQTWASSQQSFAVLGSCPIMQDEIKKLRCFARMNAIIDLSGRGAGNFVRPRALSANGAIGNYQEAQISWKTMLGPKDFNRIQQILNVNMLEKNGHLMTYNQKVQTSQEDRAEEALHVEGFVSPLCTASTNAGPMQMV